MTKQTVNTIKADKAQAQALIMKTMDSLKDNLDNAGYVFTGELLKIIHNYNATKNNDMLCFLLTYTGELNDKHIINNLKKIVLGFSGAFQYDKKTAKYYFNAQAACVKITKNKKNEYSVKYAEDKNGASLEKQARKNFSKWEKTNVENVWSFALNIENVKRNAEKKTISVKNENGTVTEENFLSMLEELRKGFIVSDSLAYKIDSLLSGNYTMGIALSPDAVAKIKKAEN